MEDLSGKTVDEMLIEAEARILISKGRHDPIRHPSIFSALCVSLDQIQYAQHLRSLVKRDPIISIHEQLRNMPVVDQKTKSIGERDEL